ncbi:efflux RND transporter periplasmic adaptor subunit [Alteraurantiacibacter palmitatis]|uniref:Efflux RND transporter periplasmic adaptor subunit n=1 Tax=Alteraurantiacibacter palmitatis TaxID=2054628 RepID=A0ABV7EBV0_9SPHN
MTPRHSIRFSRSRIACACALLVLSACGSGSPEAEDAAPDPAASSALTVETAQAVAAQGVPLARVPGQVTLPPEARVAVTAPFPGAAVRVFVIEGQAVARGAPLALVRAAEPVTIGADIARARAEVGLAQARAARMHQLASEGIIAQARADEAEAALVQARATLSEAQRMAAMSGTGADGMMTLRAPISGRVAHVGVETGGGVDGMNAPFVIEAAGPFHVDLQLPPRLAAQVRPGMAVEALLPALDGGEPLTIGGQIISVAPSIDPQTRSVMAKASISAAPGLVAGQNLMVSITSAGEGRGVSVPSRAVTRINGADHVFVRDGADYVPRPVTVVANSGGTAVISEGLEAGETIATSSIAELKSAAAE